MSQRRGSALVALFTLTLANPVGATQVLASERGKVSQTVDGTTITVEYYRPLVRGREIFGAVVPWGSIWTPGANWATTLEVDKDVRLNDHPLPKGKYSVWMQTAKEAGWTVIMSRTAKAWHLWPPPFEDEQIRFVVRADHGPPVEVLTWSFPVIMRDAVGLWMAWGTTIIPLHVVVLPTQAVLLTGPQRAVYTGRWKLEIENAAQPADTFRIEVYESKGGLKMKGMLRGSFFDPEADLIPIGAHQFHPKYYRNGRAAEIGTRETFIFVVEDTHAVTFEVRGPDNKPFARAVRLP